MHVVVNVNATVCSLSFVELGKFLSQ